MAEILFCDGQHVHRLPHSPTEWATKADFSHPGCAPESLIQAPCQTASGSDQGPSRWLLSQRTSSLGQSSLVSDLKESGVHVWGWHEKNSSVLISMDWGKPSNKKETPAFSLPLVVESGTYTRETERRGGGREQRRPSADLRHFATGLFTDRSWPLHCFSTRWRKYGSESWW